MAACLNGIAVLPVEWGDQKWIGDNIQPKLEGLQRGNHSPITSGASTSVKPDARSAASRRLPAYLIFAIPSSLIVCLISAYSRSRRRRVSTAPV